MQLTLPVSGVFSSNEASAKNFKDTIGLPI
jgi:hypothetical protein